MDIPGIAATDPAFGAGSSLPTQELDKNAFMELLVSQLKNQDPLDPASNEDFIAQLASFSSLEQLENLNDNVLGMVLLNQSNALMSQLTQGSALIGKTVGWTDPATGTSGSGVVDAIKVKDGIAFLSIGGTDIPLLDVTDVQATDDTVTEPDDGGDDADTEGEDG